MFAYSIDQATGALTLLGRQSGGGSGGPVYLSVDPSGAFLLAATYNGGTVTVRTIQHAVFTANNPSYHSFYTHTNPLCVSSSCKLCRVLCDDAIDDSVEHRLVLHAEARQPEPCWQVFPIGSDGSLSAMSDQKTLGSGNANAHMVIPHGNFIYATDKAGDKVRACPQLHPTPAVCATQCDTTDTMQAVCDSPHLRDWC